MTNMDPIMEPILKNDTLSRSRNLENDTLFSGTSPYGKIHEYPPMSTPGVADSVHPTIVFPFGTMYQHFQTFDPTRLHNRFTDGTM